MNNEKQTRIPINYLPCFHHKPSWRRKEILEKMKILAPDNPDHRRETLECTQGCKEAAIESNPFLRKKWVKTPFPKDHILSD